MEQTFKIKDDIISRTYFQQISSNRDDQFYTSPWGGSVIKNCSLSGEILQFSSINQYETFKKETRKSLWLYMPLKVFQCRGTLFGAYACPECPSMSVIKELASNQEPEIIERSLCVHSRVASMLIGNWRTLWDVTMSVSDQVFNFFTNQDTKYITFSSLTPAICSTS